ncbi:hypothetical protein IWT5_01702 [Secundilactobacillus silagincola]|uniref:Uncharacterized protein n=1 Tax=Secundilactobacillus silagincola TaxID=1714681 RepID=A0A1Z5J3F4_9LACO|nr:hypothetical protein [Secundilactobacillus silagincola]GAX08547.1 hypothetical protein IWT5_01702 [Secundilactobacillus silagincola]
MSISKATIILAITALGVFGTSQCVQGKTISHPHRTVVNPDTYGDNDGGFATNWYRLKSATNVTVTYSSTTNSNAVRKHLELPKGTIIGAQRYHQQVASKNVAYTSGYMTPNISYHLKSHLVNSKVYGFGAVSFKLPAKKVQQIVRPAYGLPYGSGTLYSGGVGAIKSLNRNVDAIKISSDGYIETYHNDPKKYPSFLGTLESHYQSKPNDSQRIILSEKTNDTVHLYYAHHLAGVNDKRVHQSGNQQYRLTIVNRHTPYQYSDSAYSSGKTIASIYSVGGSNYFTIIGSGDE